MPLVEGMEGGLQCHLPYSAMERLRSDKAFQKLFSQGERVQHPLVTLLYSPAVGPGVRAGFCVSKKFGGAVKRNRLKRRLREACRKQLAPCFEGAWEIVCLPRRRAAEVDFAALCQALGELLIRAGIAKESG
jgi:ribonuclease P protein component